MEQLKVSAVDHPHRHFRICRTTKVVCVNANTPRELWAKLNERLVVGAGAWQLRAAGQLPSCRLDAAAKFLRTDFPVSYEKERVGRSCELTAAILTD